MAFTGKGSAENNYLASKVLTIEKHTSNPQELYSLDEAGFKAKVDTIKTANASHLGNIMDADPDFVAYETIV